MELFWDPLSPNHQGPGAPEPTPPPRASSLHPQSAAGTVREGPPPAPQSRVTGVLPAGTCSSQLREALRFLVGDARVHFDERAGAGVLKKKWK